MSTSFTRCNDLHNLKMLKNPGDEALKLSVSRQFKKITFNKYIFPKRVLLLRLGSDAENFFAQKIAMQFGQI